jgi:hypothetical protein
MRVLTNKQLFGIVLAMKNNHPQEELNSFENIKTYLALTAGALALTAAAFGAHAAYEVTHVQPDVHQIQENIVGK